MTFGVYGPFEITRLNTLVDSTAAAKKTFWADVDSRVPGLSTACGCYIMVVRAKRGALPWYVGLTTKRTFAKEAYNAHQVNHYNNALTNPFGIKVGVRPELYLLPKETPTGRFAQPSQKAHLDIEFLETFLFGVAINRNPAMRNTKNTKFLRTLVVPGIINTPRRAPRVAEQSLKAALGL
ncbi:hypothetical protein BH09GEM1_BH09GEM1_07630 [soil metagenome]